MGSGAKWIAISSPETTIMMPAIRLPMDSHFNGNVKLPYIDLLDLAIGSRYQIRSTPINEIPMPIRDCFIAALFYSHNTVPQAEFQISD